MARPFSPVCLTDWVETIRAGIERNMREPGPYAAENLKPGEGGRFFDDYCNWQRIPEFVEVVQKSPAAQAAAALMRSNSAQVFHDHVLVKEPGTAKPTPWHQDAPYYFVDGDQTVSFWVPVDPVKDATCAASPDRIAGPSWCCRCAGCRTRISMPTATPISRCLIPTPRPIATACWNGRCSRAMRSRSTIAPCTARAATSPTERRRAFSLRFVGDDAVYGTRPGRTSPPFPGHDMTPGQRLREDWFPVVWRQ